MFYAIFKHNTADELLVSYAKLSNVTCKVLHYYLTYYLCEYYHIKNNTIMTNVA